MLSSWLKSPTRKQTVNSSWWNKQSYLRRKKIGAVLIEFAFSIPIFLVLMYYIHDLPKLKLIQRKNRYVANIIAALIQNISKQRRATETNLVQSDIIGSIRLASLCVFPGMTQWPIQGGTWGYSRCPLGYIPMVNLFVFTGTGTNIASRKYYYRYYPNYECFSNHHNGNDASIVKFNETNATSIHPDFQISAGETKCIIDFRFFNDKSMSFPNEVMTNTIAKRELFGFLFYNPVSPSGGGYFHGIAIFTPIWNFTAELQ